MPTQKNQHYVPKFYQRLFSEDDVKIGVFLPKERKKIDSASIKYQASEDYLYTQNTEKPDNTEAALGKIEGEAKQVIELLLQDPPIRLVPEQDYVLYVFVLLQIGRTLAQMDVLQKTANKMAQQMLMVDKQLHDKNGDNKYEGITDDIINEVGLKFANLGAFSVFTHAQLIPSCIDLVHEYKVLVNHTKVSFTTSDNPACLYNMFLEKVNQDNAGLGCRGIMFYLPLSPNRAVLFYDSKVYKCGVKRQKAVEIIDEHDVEELNKLTAINSRELFFYNPKKTNLAVLEKMANQKERFEAKEQIKDIPGIELTSGNMIIGLHRNSNKCNLHLSFIKYLPTYSLKTPKSFNSQTDLYREITYYKDKLEKEYFKGIKRE